MRQDYLEWDEVLMGIAVLAAKRSKDPNTQVGACVADQQNRIMATGYNGFPRGVCNSTFPWGREGGVLDTKYAYMCHAEANAIDNRGSHSLEGCKIYVTLFPCNECSKRIIQNGITEVIYLNDKYANTEVQIASRRLLDAAGITYRHFKPSNNIVLEFEDG